MIMIRKKMHEHDPDPRIAGSTSKHINEQQNLWHARSNSSVDINVKEKNV